MKYAGKIKFMSKVDELDKTSLKRKNLIDSEAINPNIDNHVEPDSEHPEVQSYYEQVFNVDPNAPIEYPEPAHHTDHQDKEETITHQDLTNTAPPAEDQSKTNMETTLGEQDSAKSTMDDQPADNQSYTSQPDKNTTGKDSPKEKAEKSDDQTLEEDTPKSKKNEETEKLEKAVKLAEKPLYQLSSVFPFDLFPDDIIIHANQVDIVVRDFFMAEWRQSIPSEKLADISIELGPLFGKLSVAEAGEDRKFRYFSVSFLKRDQAGKAKNIIQGLIISQKQQIDLAKVSTEGLVEKLETLGKDFPTE